MTEPYRTPSAPLRAVVGALVDGGVRDVVICPGSRSTPLALALKAAPELRCWVHLDERAGAYFALGAAKGSRRPTAVLATSGTAVVNFAPAVVEARYGRVPLILLTADRPPELQGVGAPQTIDQVELYGRHAKWFAELPVPVDDTEVLVELRGTVARAIDVAMRAPAGPVQLDVPFREPLLPDGPLRDEEVRPAQAPPAVAGPAQPSTPVDVVERLLPRIRASARPLIVSGPLDRPGFASALSRLAGTMRAPIVSDALANVRSGGHDRATVVTCHDALLRLDGFVGAHRPDLVLRFGTTPTSKALVLALKTWASPQLLVDDGGGWNTPAGDGIQRVDADPVDLAATLADAASGMSSGDPAWLAAWLRADDAAARALSAWEAELDEPFEGSVPRALEAALPDDAIVLVGNSMPVRDLDAFLPGSDRPRRFLGNRGANGIDGLIATALGISAAQPRPVVLVLGDLSFLHDLTSLLAARRLGLDLLIVLVDNDGGGIFSFLPQGTAERPELGLPEHFETLFGTPHGIDLRPLTSALGATHRRIGGGDLARAVSACIGRPGVTVLELDTDRARNVELHRDALAAVRRAVEALA